MLQLQRNGAIMQKYLDIIKKNALFESISETDLMLLLDCLAAKTSSYKKGSFIWMQGDANYKVGIVLQGKINIIKEDVMGNRSLIAGIEPPHIFGESMVSAEVSASPVSVQAAVDSIVLLMDFLRLVKTCGSSCTFHTRLIQNMLKIMARKNLYLNEKIDYLNRTTTKQKVSAYLLNHISDTNSMTAILSLNREELADYLGVNRSSLSRELSVMKNESLIDYRKNKFYILDYNALSELAF